MTVEFAAYATDGEGFSSDGRDEAAGILGTRAPNGTPPVVTAGSLAELRQRARAYLGKEPGALLYLTDADNRVHEIMINEKYHAMVERSERRTVIAVVLLIFCVTSLVGASISPSGGGGLIAFVGTVGMYTLILRSEFLNEIEGALLCEILLILALILTSAFQRARDARAESGSGVSPLVLFSHGSGPLLGQATSPEFVRPHRPE